jgi:hypothetical protein
MNVFELFGTIAINNEQANKALSDTGKQANGLSRTMESAFGKLQSTAVKIGAAVASAFAIGKIKDFGQECSQVYASVAAEQAAFGQIMGDYAVMANEKMKAVAEETGMVSTRLMPYMTSMTAKFKGLGYGVDEATSLAKEGLMIAADASAFWDKSLDESMSHLNSFINGSYEGGEAIGLFANDTQMAAYALKNGIIKETKAWAQLDEATKQSTRLQYAKEMMASSGATGQAAKEADAYANVQANLNEQFRQFKAVIGEPIMQKMILPGMQLISKLMPGITEKTEALAASFERGFDLIASYFTDVFTEDGINLDALPKAFEKMFGDIVKKAPALLAKVGNTVKTTWKNRVWPGVQSLFKAAFGVELPSWDKIVEKISYGWNSVVFPKINGFFEKTFGITLPTSWDGLVSDIKTAWETKVYPKISGFYEKTFGVPMPTSWDGFISDVKTEWETNVLPNIKGFFEKQFGITLPDSWDGLVSDVKSAWEEDVLPNIKGFFEKTFGITLPPSWDGLVSDIKDAWVNDIQPNVDDFCKVMVGMEPTDADSEGTAWATKLKTWFDGITQANAEMFNLTVGLLMNDTDKTGKRWSEAIADWFHGIVQAIGESLGVSFKLLMPTESETADMQNTITTWLHGADGKSGVVGMIANAIAFPFDLAFQECVNIWESFQEWLSSLSESDKPTGQGESDLALGAKYDYRLWGYGKEELDLLQKWIDAVNEANKLDFTSTEEDVLNAEAAKDAARQAMYDSMGFDNAEQLISDYMSWLSGQVDAETEGYFKDVPLSLAEGAGQALQTEIDGIGLEASVTLYPDYSGMNGVSAALGSDPVDGSHAKGLDFVPRDNYLARLHKGEAVLTSAQADAWRSGSMGSVDIGRLETAINNMAAMMQQLVQSNRSGTQIVLDSGVLVGQLAPALDTQLGTISTRKGRRN